MPTSLSKDRIEARLRIVDEHLRAENSNDLEAIMGTFAPHSVFVLNGDTFTGHESIRSAYEYFGFGGRGAFTNLHLEVKQRHISDDAIILEGTITGEHIKDWQGIAATGRKFDVPFCAVLPFDEADKLVGERAYFDGVMLLKQLGVK